MSDREKSKGQSSHQPATSKAEVPQRQKWKADTQAKIRDNHRVPYSVKAHPDKQGNYINEIEDNEELSCSLFETTGFTDTTAVIQLIHQVSQGQPNSQDIQSVNASISMLNGIAPENPLEGLLGAQMVAVHNMAMEFTRRAMKAEQSTDGVDRNVNRTVKLMRTFTAQVEALNKLRNKGQQKITVQHVQVGHGGQAIIGDVNSGGQHYESR